jgi:hypothetical protein
MRWSEFAEAEPRLAALGRQRLVEPGVVLVGTIRQDGSPRISPVEPLLWERDLWLSMLLGSYKAADLQRDPRVLVHSIVTGRDGSAGEYKVRGAAVEERFRPVQEDTRRRSALGSAGARSRVAFTCFESMSRTSPSSATRSARVISSSRGGPASVNSFVGEPLRLRWATLSLTAICSGGRDGRRQRLGHRDRLAS